MFSNVEAKHAFVFILGSFVISLFLFFPSNTLLPAPFLQFVPDWLQDMSLLTYIQLHIDFFMSLIIPIGLVMIILYLWSKR